MLPFQKLILIGARGVGKTALMRRLSSRLQNYKSIDLDRVIADQTGRPVEEIFAQDGEDQFRVLEHLHLTKVLADPDRAIISLGAGFRFDGFVWPDRSSCQIVWVQRESDSYGRIFLNRPRLDRGTDPLSEFLSRYQLRKSNYGAQCDWIYCMPEGTGAFGGNEDWDRDEARLFLQRADVGGVFTLKERHLKWFKFLDWGFEVIELRDDLLSLEACERAIRAIRRHSGDKVKILLSFRKENNSDIRLQLLRLAGHVDLFDWASELGNPPEGVRIDIWSAHGNEPPAKAGRLKWSPHIEDWAKLMAGVRWQNEDPSARSFLPRSQSGRWRWLRRWLKGRQELNFLRDSSMDDDVMDQPTLMEWLATPHRCGSFAGVLGSPVALSWSPRFHRKFFWERKMPFFAIRLDKQDVNFGLEQLRVLGLRAAAVTSPLKTEIAPLARPLHAKASLSAANTLLWADDEWLSAETDSIGLETFRPLEVPIVVWGGGGVRSAIERVFPEAIFVSSRTGLTEEGSSPAIVPKTIIWAASPDAALPQLSWKPDVVCDLNYHEFSRAREYAMSTGARYVSGAQMFCRQASAQQSVWENQKF